VTAELVPLTQTLSAQVDPRRCDFDRLIDVDLEVGRRVRDVLVAENLAAFLPDPSAETVAAARRCSGILIAGRAARAQRLREIRAAWSTTAAVAR
jgi:hypothetical protein